jgi:hypothetical protein
MKNMEEKTNNIDYIEDLHFNINTNEKIEEKSKNEKFDEIKNSNKNLIKNFFNEFLSSTFDKYTELFDNFEKKKFYFSHIQKIFEVNILKNFFIKRKH